MAIFFIRHKGKKTGESVCYGRVRIENNNYWLKDWVRNGVGKKIQIQALDFNHRFSIFLPCGTGYALI
jgi:hypothetical protein